MEVKERLLQFIKENNISVSQFEKMCGMSNGYVNSIRKGVGLNKLEKILIAFPELNKDWLIRGHGDMYIEITNQNI